MTNPKQLRHARDWQIEMRTGFSLGAVAGFSMGSIYFYSHSLQYACTLDFGGGTVGAGIDASVARQLRGAHTPTPSVTGAVNQRRNQAVGQIASRLSATQSNQRILTSFCTNDLRGGRYRAFSVGARAGVGASGIEVRIYDNNGTHVATLSSGGIGVEAGVSINLGTLGVGVLINHCDAPLPLTKDPSLSS